MHLVPKLGLDLVVRAGRSVCYCSILGMGRELISRLDKISSSLCVDLTVTVKVLRRTLPGAYL